MKKLSLTIFIMLLAAQFAVPFSRIIEKERILSRGERFRFRTRPIDPADPFQGRYVRLGFDADYIPLVKGRDEAPGRKSRIYALIGTDEEGFAHFTGWSYEKPEHQPYLKTRSIFNKTSWNPDTKTHDYLGVRIRIPFERFYMDEAKAPRAEGIARDAGRSTNCWAEVAILNGSAVIDDVFAQGQSLRVLASEKE